MNEKLFNIGDTAWYARTGFQDIQATCPVCFGNKSVTVILGNGDEVIVPCSYCALGYDAPSGIVKCYRIQPAATPVTITGREIREGEKTEVTYYGPGAHFYRSHTLFESFAEALAASKELCEKELHDRETCAEWIKKDKTKSFAWNAGYHLTEARRLREQIDYHERMALVCKSRTKEEK